MNRDDLLRLLDLPGHEADGPPAPDLVLTTPEIQEPASSTALELDDWGRRRGQDLLMESPRLQQTGLEEEAIADFHGAAFEPEPRLLPRCQDERRRCFLDQLFQTPDYQALHEATMLDETTSSLVATIFAEQFCDLIKEDSSSLPGSGTRALLRAVGNSLTRADQEVTSFRETCAALGIGPGKPGTNDPATIAGLFRRVRRQPSLDAICALAGRYRRLAQSRQRSKVRHGLDDLVGVVQGSDVGKLLPQELSRLALDELADDTLRRLIEGQCLCREQQGWEPVGKGPVLVCVDESGSMEGDRVHTAKALALALIWIARQQRRWSGLVAYSGDSGERVLALPPGQGKEEELLSWLEGFIGHGSSIDVPVRELPRIYQEVKAPPGQTDVIFLTDARCVLPGGVRQTFLNWKKSVQARLLSLVIAAPPGDLTSISDEVHQVGSLSLEEEAVGRVLSL